MTCCYTEYRTGNVIGGEGVQPLIAFQPLPMPDGDEGEGPNDIAFAPPKCSWIRKNSVASLE